MLITVVSKPLKPTNKPLNILPKGAVEAVSMAALFLAPKAKIPRAVA